MSKSSSESAIFSESEKQKDEAKSKFEYCSSYIDLTNQRIKVIRSYFEKVKKEYEHHAEKVPILKVDKFKQVYDSKPNSPPVAPGIPGGHLNRLTILSNFTKQITIEYKSFSKFLEESIINSIRDFEVKSDSRLKNAMDNYNSHLKYRRDCKNAVLQSQKDLLNAKKSAESLNKDLLKAKKEGKQAKIDKITKDLRTACQQYQKCVNEVKINVMKFNTAHRRFIEVCGSEITMLNALHPERIELLSNVVGGNIIPSLTTYANMYKDVEQWFVHSALPWDSDFLRWTEANGVCRRPCVLPDFIPLRIECDAKIGNEVIPARQTQIDAPLIIARVVRDYTASSPFKMSVKTGQLVPLYEPPFHTWVLARDPLGQKRYLPSEAVVVDKQQIALARMTQLPTTPGFLQIIAGELLLLESLGEQTSICCNISGERGEVPNYAIIKETQNAIPLKGKP